MQQINSKSYDQILMQIFRKSISAKKQTFDLSKIFFKFDGVGGKVLLPLQNMHEVALGLRHNVGEMSRSEEVCAVQSAFLV